jgi:putative hemolysin
VNWRDRLRAVLGREAAEVRDAASEARRRLEEDLARREAEAAETPEQRFARLQREIGEQGDPFAEVRDRLDGGRGPGDTPS